MLDGMPAVRVKAEPLESEQGVREDLFSRQFPVFFLFFLPPFFPFLFSSSRRWADNHSQASASE